MAKILISGGSGLIGKAITRQLLVQGHEVVWTGRTGGQWEQVKIYKADWRKNYLEEGAVKEVTHVILLAGAGVMDQRWTAAYKEEILESRVRTIALICAAFEKTGVWPQVVIGASATGFYGTKKREGEMTENSAAGKDYLSDVCEQWEAAYQQFPEQVRLVKPRISIVLSREGGAFVPLSKLCKAHISAQSGDGTQHLPWIHVDDLCQFFMRALTDEHFAGPYNMVAPEIVTNKYFAEMLAAQSGKRILSPPAPAFVLRLLLGERAVTLTSGLRIRSEQLGKTAFVFKYPKLEEALHDLCTSL